MDFKGLRFIKRICLVILISAQSTILSQSLWLGQLPEMQAEKIYEMAVKSLERGEAEIAIQLLFRYGLRAYQDAACSTDVSTKAALDAFSIFCINCYDPRVAKTFEKMGNIPHKEHLRLKLSQVNLVQAATDRQELESPFWIAKYGMQVPFFGQKVEDIFVAPDQWQEKRQQVLDQLKEMIQKELSLQS